MQALRPFLLWSQYTWANREVVGESYRAAEIRALFPQGRPVRRGDEIKTIARLVPEPTNPHDPRAVAVYVKSTLVGYLAKAEAAHYQPVILNLNRRGYEAQVPCEISGHEYQRQETDKRGRVMVLTLFDCEVRICLDEWYRCVPVNPAPPNHVLYPHGSALQLQKEEDHQAVLQRYLSAHRECWAYGTLHEIQGGTEKAPKPLVEVRIDGERVGQLTPAMSAHFLPTMSALTQHGKTSAVKLLVKGSELKVEVVLFAARAHDLDPSWVREHVGSAGFEPRRQFNPAPGWPAPPPGWTPPAGWQPDPGWPPAPIGWRFWI